MKKYIFSIIFLILGLVSFIVYLVNGSSVKADGTLVEAFAFIPIGYLLVSIGLVSGVFIAIVTKVKKK
ncbi:MAG: DUF3955 domain-containing protein [Firmicutes bacterium]|nr:DUF3955 domain-containing protein [Bacillota bacterium]